MLYIQKIGMGKTNWRIAATFLAVITFVGVAVGLNHQADATGETIVGGNTFSGRVNQQIPISDLSINGTGNDIIPVKLHVGQGTLYMTSTEGLSFTGPSVASTLQFSGTRSDVNSALATLHYSGTSAGVHTLSVSLAESNTIYNPENNHVYQYVGDSLTWYAARDAAAASTYQGIHGYLATITSDAENQFIKDRLSGDAWLGASDDDQYMGEGTWSWTGGPEAGTNFYNGRGNFGGAAVGGNYANWAPGEPNQFGNEDCMETYISSGTWNDLPCNMTIGGYVVEYGDSESTPAPIPTKDITITLAAAEFADGDGTAEDPYVVTDCERLQDLNQNMSAHYMLTHNIDCTETAGWNGGQGFLPIGDDDNHFSGTIHGNGYTIDGLQQIRADDDPGTSYSTDPATDQSNVGLIGYGGGVVIDDLHLTNAKIKGYQYVGGLVGFMDQGTITDSSVNRTTANNSCNPGNCIWARYGIYGGGLVGYMYGGTISGSSTGGPVKGSGNVIGGLVGMMDNDAHLIYSSTSSYVDGGRFIGGAVGQIYNSHIVQVSASGNVIARIDDEADKPGYYAGGLVGYGSGSETTIDESYATGDVHADYGAAGGFAGYMEESTLHDIYATGTVTATESGAGGLIGGSMYNVIARAYASGNVQADYYAGGLIGESYQTTIGDSFSAGGIIANNSTGGIIGYSTGDVFSHDYFDLIRSGQASCTAGGSDSECTGVNADGTQPKYLFDYVQSPFTQSSSRVWSEGVWYFDGTHYPVLRMGVNSSPSVRPTIEDNDGVSAATENAGPNHGDGNSDGVQDSEQSNVTSFVNPKTGHYVTLETDNICDIKAIASAAETANAKTDSEYSYPFGLLNYTVDCGTPGYSTGVTIYFDGVTNVSGMIVRKYNSTTKTYATIPSAVISGSNPVKLTYTVKDGEGLDEDGMVNGIIVDPIGLASHDILIPGVPNTGVGRIIVSTGVPLVIISLLVSLASIAWPIWRHRLNRQQ